jgi:hypothetical protein
MADRETGNNTGISMFNLAEDLFAGSQFFR